MSKLAITDGLVLLGGYDLSGCQNAIASSYGAVALNATVLGNKTVNNMGGLKTTKVSVKGFWDATADDAPTFADIGLTDIMTFGFTKTEGGIVYFQKQMEAQYSTGTTVGSLMPYSLSAEAAGDLVRATLLAKQAGVVASGHGSGFQLGAVASGKSVYAALHVTAAGGTSEHDTVILESSVDNTFGSPTTRITFADAGASIGAQLLSLAGPVTDTWWRLKWTLSGTLPSYDFAGSVGIQ